MEIKGKGNKREIKGRKIREREIYGKGEAKEDGKRT